MTKSFARKVSAGKAHSRGRKTASKVVAEKARTYRKTAAQFEEFARDAQMPESLRALAEKSVAQTRALCEHSLETALDSWERFVFAAGQGAVALNLAHQAGEMRMLPTKVTTDVAAPIKAQVTRGMKGLHKAT